MADTGVRIEGLTKAIRNLKALGLDVEDLKDAFARIAAEGAETVSKYVPRRSGALAGSVRGNRAQSKAVVTTGRASIPYAGPINYGWPSRNIAASNFIQKADAEITPRALGLLEEEINKAIKRNGLN